MDQEFLKKHVYKKTLVNPRDVCQKVERVQLPIPEPKPIKIGARDDSWFETEETKKRKFFAHVYNLDRSNLLERRNLRQGGYMTLRGAIRGAQKVGTACGIFTEDNQLVAVVWVGEQFPFAIPSYFREWLLSSTAPRLAAHVMIDVGFWQYLNIRS